MAAVAAAASRFREKMTATYQHATSVDLVQCPACLDPWSAGGRVCIPVAGLADGMLDGTSPATRRIRLRTLLKMPFLDRHRHAAESGASEEIYQHLPPTYWQGLNPQSGLNRLVESYLRRRGVVRGDLWDVGCGGGNVLASFGPQWIKAGIEPGLEAVAQARSLGLNVTAGTASSLRLTNVADVAISIEVADTGRSGNRVPRHVRHASAGRRHCVIHRNGRRLDGAVRRPPLVLFALHRPRDGLRPRGRRHAVGADRLRRHFHSSRRASGRGRPVTLAEADWRQCA